jgi:tetratricopeptide (TPR) repeat protein
MGKNTHSPRSSSGSRLDREVLFLKIVLLVIAVLALISSFNPQWRIWGLDYLRSFSVWLRLALLALLAVSVVPGVSDQLAKRLLGFLKGSTGSRFDIFSLACIGFLAALFVIFSNNNQVLGDGFHLLEKLGGGPIASFEPMEQLMKEGIFALLGRGEAVILWSYRVSAYVAGIFLLYGLFRFTEKRAEFLLVAACLLTFGVAQFFFGYVERYTFAFVFISLYLISAHRDLDRRTISWKTPVFLLLAISMHLASGAVLPSFIYLVHRRYHSWRNTGVALAALLVIFVAALIYASDFRSLSLILLPLTPVADNPYGILTVRHILDLTNVALLGHPLIFAAVPLLLFGRIKYRGLYILALAGTLIFVVTIDPLLTAIRDWDLLSFSAAPVFAIMVAFLRKWYRADSLRTAALIVPLSLFALLHTGSFIWQNYENPRAAWDYFKRVVLDDPHLSVQYRQAGQFTNWKQTVFNVMKDTTETERIIEKWSQILTLPLPKNEIFDNRVLLVEKWAQLREWKKAASLFSGHEADLFPHADLVEFYGYVLEQAGYHDRAGGLYEQYANRGGNNPRILFLLGRYRFQQGNFRVAWELINRSLSDYPTAPNDMRLNFAALSWVTGHVPEAVSNLRALRGRMSPQVNARIDAALDAVAHNDKTRADSLFNLFWSRSPETKQ